MPPHDFGKSKIVENCLKIDINQLIREIAQSMKKILLESRIEALGANIKLASTENGFGGLRLWFQCSVCKKRVGILYIHPVSKLLGCRKCLKLDYRKHRYKGMIESSIK